MPTRRGGDDMSGKSIISNSYLEDIGDAIRYKKFTDEKYYPSQMADAIRSIDAPDEYSGATEVTPSDTEQVLPTKDKLVRDDITVNPAPTETLLTTENGTFTPSEGKVGFSQVSVDVQPDLRPLSVTENGSYEPDGFDGYNRVEVSVEGQWIDYDDAPVTLPEEYQRVEYIESSGTQFIELPIGFYPTDTIHLKGANHQNNKDDKYLVAPKTWNNDRNRFALIGNNQITTFGTWAIFGFGNADTTKTFYSPTKKLDNQIHKLFYKNRVSIIDNPAICAVACGDIDFGSETANLKLFYGYNSNTAGKICYYIHEKADGRKLALYACYRKLDGVIGMYDVENDVFYTNNGTGEFTKGQDI